MLLSKETTVKLNDDYCNIISHMNYAAYKLWNVCNYERCNYKELGLEKFPDWYYQKKYHIYLLTGCCSFPIHIK